MENVLTRLRRVNSLWWQVGLAVLAVLLPLPMSDYFRSVLWRTGLYVMLGLSLNIIPGNAGLFRLAPAKVKSIFSPGESWTVDDLASVFPTTLGEGLVNPAPPKPAT